MPQPKISVVMSVHNGQRYLNEAIESILAQTYKNFEFLIVDDASNDKSVEIIEQFAKKDKRIITIQNRKKLGLTKSLIKAIALAKGEYIARQDADDISLPNRFREEIEFLENNPYYGMVCSNFYEIDSEGRIRNKVSYENFNFRKDLIKRNPVFHGSIMIRKNILNNVDNYNNKWRYAQDYELYFRILKISKIKVLNNFLGKRRYDKGMISIRKLRKQRYFALKAQIKALFLGCASFGGILAIIKSIFVIIMPSKIRSIFKKIKGEYWFEKD